MAVELKIKGLFSLNFNLESGKFLKANFCSIYYCVFIRIRVFVVFYPSLFSGLLFKEYE